MTNKVEGKDDSEIPDPPELRPGDQKPAQTIVVSQPRRLKEWVIDNAPLLAAVVTAGLFVLIIASLFVPFVRFSGEPQATLLRELSVTEIARGLITFLVAVSTVGIALILTVYAVATQDPKAKENFAMAKEVFTGLIGVLGTIIGFYFGSTTLPTSQQTSATTAQVSAMKITNAKTDPTIAKRGDKVKITAEVSGGKPPYDYVIGFKPEGSVPPVKKEGSDGKIAEEFTVPQGLSPGSTLDVTIKVKDQAGASIDSDKPAKVSVNQ